MHRLFKIIVAFCKTVCILLNFDACGNNVTYYVWFSYILYTYVRQQRFCNYVHGEMRSGSSQNALLAHLSYAQDEVL